MNRGGEGDGTPRHGACRLYLITPPRFEVATFSSDLAAALDAGDVACVQLRLKDVADDVIRQACKVLRPLVQERDVAFLLNDRPDLAAELGCDGVHVGQHDVPYAPARKLVGADAIIGVTCHGSRHLAMQAAEAGADYVAFGSFFPSPTKEPLTSVDTAILRWWSELITVPCVAIGGINAGNCRALIEAGADFLAVCSGVWQHPAGPAAAVRALRQEIERARRAG